MEELAKLSPWTITRKKIEVGLSLLVALFIELGSGLGLYIATTPWRGDTRQKPAGKGRGVRDDAGNKGKGAMKLGAIDQFMLERLEPKAGAQLSGGDLFLAYRKWCSKNALIPMARRQFGNEFAQLAAASGIVFSGQKGHGVYRDVAVD